jgi:hypothetical protein
LQTPYNVAAGNSSGYNYSSGRLDFQIYERSIELDRNRFEITWLNRIFAAWVREAVLIEGYLPQTLRMIATDWAHAWHWDGFAHIDPQSEAEAQKIRLESQTTTLAEEWAREGKDWEEQLEICAKIKQRQQQLDQQYAVTGTGEVQGQALNGIQITAMTGVLAQVASKQITPAAAKIVLQISFPTVDVKKISDMIDAMAGAVAPDPQAQPVGAAA